MIQIKGFRQRDALESYERALADLLNKYAKQKLFAAPLTDDDPEQRRRSLAEGRFLLEHATLEPDRKLGQKLAFELLELMSKHLPDDAEGLAYLKDTFVSQEIKCPDFLVRLLHNESEELNECIHRYNLKQDWVEYFGLYLSRPFRAKAAQELVEGVQLAEWHAGYCPVCGHWPGMTRLLGHDERELWCQHCTTTWHFPGHSCPYCLSGHTMPFQIFSRHGGALMKAMTCSSCRGYVKSYRPKGQDVNLSPDAAWLATLELDEALTTEGFVAKSPLELAFNADAQEERTRYRDDLLGTAHA